MEDIVVASLPREGSSHKLENIFPASGLLHLHRLLVLVNQLGVLVSLGSGVQADGSSMSLLLVQKSQQPERLIRYVEAQVERRQYYNVVM